MTSATCIPSREPHEDCSSPMAMGWGSDPRPKWLVQLGYEQDPTASPSGASAKCARLEGAMNATGMAGGAAVSAGGDLIRVDVLVKEDDQRLAVAAARLVTKAADNSAGRLLRELVSWEAVQLVGLAAITGARPAVRREPGQGDGR